MDETQSSFISIPEYVRHLSEELEIQGADGLAGNEMEIIALVRNCPFLYDKSYPDFKDVDKKNLAWQAIAGVFNVKASDLRPFWKNMREAYGRYTNDAITDPRLKTYCTYFDEMKFLRPFILRRQSSVFYPKEESYTSASSEPENTNNDRELKLEELIDEVRKNSILYDKKHADAKNHDLKLKTWKKVAKDLGISVSECVNKWKLLREKYSKQRRQRKLSPWSRKWSLFDKLLFLEDHVMTRKRFSHTQMQGKISKIISNSDTSQSFQDSSSNPFQTEHQYCIMDNEPEQDIEYISVEGFNTQSLFKTREEKAEIIPSTSDRADDTLKDEDELFGLAIAAELRKISSNRKKMKLKADIYSLLSARPGGRTIS